MKIIIKTFLLFLVFATFLLFQSCEEVPKFEPDDQLPVVEAFLYANKPVGDITITSVVPFGSMVEDVSLSGLEISIVHNDTNYLLTEKSGAPGNYFYDGTNLSIRSGENYQLAFDFNGRRVTSKTTVPFPPEGVSISDNEIFLPQIIERSDLLELLQSQGNNILVEWENPGGDYYFVVVENISENPEPIDLNNILDFNFRFISRPTQNDFFTLRPLAQFTQFGKHRIIVYRVNEEYALLYETLDQDSRDLNEPFSNITNGVGLFSGFASDTLYLEIRKQ